MSDTPSTDELEENYIYARYDHGPLETAEDAGGEWDRGIKKVRREAKAEALRKAARSFRPLHRGREDDYIGGRADERHDLCAQLTLIADDIEEGRDE